MTIFEWIVEMFDRLMHNAVAFFLTMVFLVVALTWFGL